MFMLQFTTLVFPLKCSAETKFKNDSFASPVMSIVIDDFGSPDQSGVETMLSAKVPLTCAVMPNVEFTKQNIKDIQKYGHELILHMPMQSHVNLPESWYGPTYIANSDTDEQAKKKIDDCIKDFPNIKGFNMHIGSGVGRNERLMSAIYDYANLNGLYFLDSRTIETNATVEACKKTSSIYLGRDIFLEADKNRSYDGVKHRLMQGAELAKNNGYSIVIGHVGAEGGQNTANAILDMTEEIEKMGVKIVPLSFIYENLKQTRAVQKF